MTLGCTLGDHGGRNCCCWQSSVLHAPQARPASSAGHRRAALGDVCMGVWVGVWVCDPPECAHTHQRWAAVKDADPPFIQMEFILVRLPLNITAHGHTATDRAPKAAPAVTQRVSADPAPASSRKLPPPTQPCNIHHHCATCFESHSSQPQTTRPGQPQTPHTTQRATAQGSPQGPAPTTCSADQAVPYG